MRIKTIEINNYKAFYQLFITTYDKPWYEYAKSYREGERFRSYYKARYGEPYDADRQRDARVIQGTVVNQIERIMDYLGISPFLPTAARKDGRGRLDLPSYSLRALQKAVTNAVVHRDYSIRAETGDEFKKNIV